MTWTDFFTGFSSIIITGLVAVIVGLHLVESMQKPDSPTQTGTTTTAFLEPLESQTETTTLAFERSLEWMNVDLGTLSFLFLSSYIIFLFIN